MNSIWMTVLTPTWLFGSAFVGGAVYCLLLFLVKLALFVFRKKNKGESSLDLTVVQCYLNACLFLISQLYYFTIVILMGAVLQTDPMDNTSILAKETVLFNTVGLFLLLLVEIFVFLGTHINVR